MCKFSPSLTKCTQMATRLNISSQVSHHWWNDFRNNVDEFISTNCNELIKWVLARDILLIYDQILRNNITAPFNNMQTLTFKAQPTNAFFATVNQMFGDSSQLLTTVEHAVIKSLSTVQTMKQCSAVVTS